MRKTIVLLLLSHVITATSVIMIKASSVHPFLLATGRLLVAATLLAPLYVVRLKKERLRLSIGLLRPSFWPGVFLAVHFMTWNAAARMTLAANSTLVVNMVPIAMPFVIFFLTREMITKREVVATLLSIAGVVVLAAGNIGLSVDYVAGDILCFISMLFLTSYLALARRSRTTKSIILYVVPLYAIAGLVCLAVSLVAVRPLNIDLSPIDLVAIGGLAIGPTIIGHSAANYAMGVVPSQIVSLAQVTQVGWATIMAVLVFGEYPTINFFPAMVLIISAIALAISAHAPKAGQPLRAR